MGSLIVRNIDGELIARLKEQAAAHGRSAEAEHREILRRALTEGTLTMPFGALVFASVVSLWEIVVKVRVGELEADIGSITEQFAPASKLRLLGISPQHLQALNLLPLHGQHLDPFDHLLIAQAMSEGMTLVTRDRNARLYPIQILAA